MNQTNPPPPYSDTQRREASEWFVTVRSGGEVSNETLQDWLGWMAREDGNRLAFEAVSNAWHSMPASLSALQPTEAELSTDSYDGEQPLSEWLQSRPLDARPATGQSPRFRPRGKAFAWSLAASLAALSLGVFGLVNFDRHSNSSDEFVTRTGEQLELTLTDGSHVWLGAKSRLLVQYTKQQRGVRLDSGEAYFSVKKDRSRPFTVRADNREITAVGTSFDVRQASGRVTVEVSEGIVSVVSDAPASSVGAAVRVASGQELMMDPKKSPKDFTVVQSAKVGERARWRQGMLIYRNEPLRDVVSDVARYSNRELAISDDSVGNLRFSGVVYKSAVDEWVTALPEAFPVTLVTEGDRLTITAR